VHVVVETAPFIAAKAASLSGTDVSRIVDYFASARTPVT